MTATLKINKAASVITANDLTVTYNKLAHSISGTLNHDETTLSYKYGSNDSQATPIEFTNVGTYTVTISAIETANYLSVSKNVTLTINKATYDMSNVIFNGHIKTYDGNAYPLSISGTLPGEAGEITVSYVNNDQVNAGEHTVTAKFSGDADNYNLIPDKTAVLKINKATHDISGLVYNDTFTYDKTNHSLSIEETSLPEGVLIASYDNNSYMNAGTYNVTVNFTVADLVNYNAIAPIIKQLTINKMELTVNIGSDSKTYGEFDPVFTYTSNELEGDTISITLARVQGENVGDYTIGIVASNVGNNYVITTVNPGTLTIIRKVITVTPHELSKDYSEPDPEFTYDAPGLIGTYSFSGAITRDMTADNPQLPGTYEILIGTLNDPTGNYTINFVSGKLFTINPIDFDDVTMEGKTVTYNGQEHSIIVSAPVTATVTYKYEGLPNQTTPFKFTEAGTYTISATVTMDGYYPKDLGPVDLVINKAESVITVSDKTVTYDGKAHSITATLNHDQADLEYIGNGKILVDTYTVFISVPESDNYFGASTQATLTIEKAQATIDAENLTVTYNKAAHSIAGTLNHDETTVKYQAAGVAQQSTPIEFTNAGTYVITISAIETANYLSVSKNVTLTINKATYDMSNVTFNGHIKTYDGNAYPLSISGTLPGEPGEITVSYVNNDRVNAGEHTVTAKFSGDADNYNLIPDKTAVLKINQAQSVITVSDKTVTYDGHAHSITATLNHDQADLEYIGNGQTQAGEHTITISVPESTNYLGASTTAKLTINKAQSVITVEGVTVTYDGNVHSIEASLNHSEKPLVYDNNDKTNAGTYQVTISVDESTNYLGTSTTATLKINQAQSVITVSDKTVTYDGHAHSITATLNHNQAELEYIGNGQTQAGEHTITISVPESTNYLGASTTAKLTINKAQSVITVEGVTVTYDGNVHSIEASLNHSEKPLVYDNNDKCWYISSNN
jgi:hypothetical protein